MKAVLITGAAKRLGRAIALDMAAHGWSVAIHYHSAQGKAEETVLRLLEAGAPKAIALQADLTNEDEMQHLVPRATEALEMPLSCLINNASIFEYDNWQSSTRENWDRHLESNLRAPFVLSQQFANQAPAAKQVHNEPVTSANIINIIDQRVWKLTPEFMSYTIAKAGLWTLTQTMAQALTPNVRVNAIGPGPTLANPRQSEAHFARQRESTLLNRGVDPDDITAGIQYILSAKTMTGQMLALDAGQQLNWQTPDIMGIKE